VLFRADQSVVGRHELLRVPLAGGASPVPLSGTLAAGQSVSAFRLADDGSRVLFTLVDGGRQRTSLVPADGSAAPVALDAAPGFAGRVRNALFSPDGASVALVADVPVRLVNQLFVVPSDASAPPRLVSAPVLNETGVHPGERSVRFTPDGRHLVYFANRLGPMEIHAAPVDGGAPAVTLNAPFDIGGQVLGLLASTPFLITPDSEHVLFSARLDGASPTRLFVAPLDGTSAPLDLGPDEGAVPEGSARLSADGARVVYAQLAAGRTRLYQTLLRGASNARAVSDEFEGVGLLGGEPFAISPQSDQVLFISDQLQPGHFGLFVGLLGHALRPRELPQVLVER